jgi:hypothetical protein
MGMVNSPDPVAERDVTAAEFTDLAKLAGWRDSVIALFLKENMGLRMRDRYRGRVVVGEGPDRILVRVID